MEHTSNSSSKVTVEYHDPSGVFPLVSRDITARLPLRNLNWQSPPRPLRQIKSLHVDFVPDKYTQSHLRPPVSRTDSDDPQNSFDIVRSGAKNAAKERRHQIPGFRTTPYLKIYVLRCDDKEAYKDSDRKKIREWIRENAQPEGKQNHDACEWLILHVVIPDTIAASEPRWRESSKDPDDLKERKGGNKLIGKSTRTVFDRLRADFNESSKSSIDRVAQLRIPKKEAPGDLLPTPAVAQTLEETPQERENAWSDLISKLKALLLGPFDRRVRQYEADIAEQESRRSLPGWNFCTFFIHKEGLAKALESIGLVEDALAIYDELSLGLETIFREMAAGQAQGTATSFAAYTDDIKQRIRGPPQPTTNGNHRIASDDSDFAAALFDKDYREKIVRSDISVFDFLSYIFIRQKALVLRLANAQSARTALGAAREGGEDLVLTSELCWRASSFLHNAARALREDLIQGLQNEDREAKTLEIESLVGSWTWTVASQILADTSVPALMELTKSGIQNPAQLPNGTLKRSALSMGLGANTHPQRTSSLPDSKAAAALIRPPTRNLALDDTASVSSDGHGDSTKIAGLPGQAELATYRAELIMMRRKVLEQLACRRRWYAGWAFAKNAKRGTMEEVDLDETVRESPDVEEQARASQVLGPTLVKPLESEATFEAEYESLTELAIRHYFTATQGNSARVLLGDLAMLKCQQDDYLTAATYFESILPPYNDYSWDSMEIETLSTYSYCLKRLLRKNEFVQTVLALLAKVCARRREHSLPRKHPRAIKASSHEDMETAGMFIEAVDTSEELQEDVTQPLKKFFSDVKLEHEINHCQSSDAFGLLLNLRHVLDDNMAFDEAKVRLISVHDSTQEVWLANRAPVMLTPGLNQIELRGSTVSHGAFLVDTIVLQAKKVRFVEEVRAKPDPTPLGITVIAPTTTIRDSSKVPPFVFLYPREHAFDAQMRRSSDIHIDRPRHFEVALDAGQNEISSIAIRLKPASAGLRLHLADAKADGIAIQAEENRPGVIGLAALPTGQQGTITVPYTTEHPVKDVMVRLEVEYTTNDGTFTFLQSGKMPNELPLDVDVNDIFQLDTLFSSFTVRTTAQTPVIVLDAQLDASPLYAVEAPPALPLPLPVLQSQPMDLVYKITRAAPANKQVLKRDAALALGVRYLPLDELCLSCLRQSFVKDLQQSQFSNTHRLLVPLLLERARQCVQAAELEMAALIGEAKTPDFDAIGWNELIATLSVEIRQPLGNWLRQWHSDHKVLSLADADGTVSQRITISVDVPNVDMVFSSALNLVEPPLSPVYDPPILTLGSPVKASVRVKHTGDWSAKSVFPSVPTFKMEGENESSPAFVVDVGTESDTWLVGGQRRRHFVPEDGADYTFDVLVVPLRLGLQPLPIIEVRQESTDFEFAEHTLESAGPSCESRCETAGTLVQVIRDARSATVHIPESTPATNQLPPSRPGTATSKDPA
ncbi:hypothetical protein AC578_370 [Pseudocercospora eumusae]|uniref:Trafficking protein particle complex subunit 11 domain-containing protein n=1 Tax=Pseudocercospora eumusae TaxID=321146 RepID=A0A139HU25_9PEZI|nr:hypothetical protein AC578_370 [Pseudocercospora eumusae]